MSFNPNKKLSIEIHSNDMANVYGYTIWHVVGGERKAAISRKADGKDFDWMSEKQQNEFEKGKYTFKISAQDALDYFSYLY